MSKYNKKQNCSICQFERGKHSFECKYYKEIIPKERAESGESIVDILNEGQREEIEKNKLIARIIEREIEKAKKEERERIIGIIKPCLRYCQKQNGLPYCKNCGLSDEIINKIRL